MMIRLSLLVCIGVILSCACVAGAAPSFDFTTFPDAQGLQLDGSASVTGGLLRLTPSQRDQRSAAWVTAPQDVTRSFQVSYTFTIHDAGADSIALPPNGADGLALVIQNDPRPLAQVLGLGGGGDLGYGAGSGGGTAITRSLAVALQTYAYHRLRVFTNADDPNLTIERYTTVPLASQSEEVGTILGIPETVTFAYDAGAQAVTVRLNGSAIGIEEVPLGRSLADLVGGPTAYFGLTSATGSAYAVHDVSSFSAGAAVPEPGLALEVGALGMLAGLTGSRRRSGRR